MPKISVVVPAYNAEGCIVECIESVKAQTLNDFECICVDDGSTDGTADACLKAFDGDQRFRLIRQKHCCGAAARNAGLDAASGKYVQFMDSDDLLVPDALFKASEFIERNGLEMVMFDAEIRNVNASRLHYLHAAGYAMRKRNYGICSGRDVIMKMVADRRFNCYVFLQMVRRDCIRSRFPVLPLDEDLAYTIQNVSLLKRVGHLSERLYVKRLMSGSVLYGKLSFEKTVSLMKATLLVEEWVDRERVESALGDEYVSSLACLIESFRREAERRWQRLDADERAKFSRLPFAERMQFKRFLTNEKSL